jgi:hypothetical protein
MLHIVTRLISCYVTVQTTQHRYAAYMHTPVRCSEPPFSRANALQSPHSPSPSTRPKHDPSTTNPYHHPRTQARTQARTQTRPCSLHPHAQSHPHPLRHRTQHTTMPQTLYPRGTLKKIVKAHANRPLSKNVDILVRTHARNHNPFHPHTAKPYREAIPRAQQYREQSILPSTLPILLPSRYYEEANLTPILDISQLHPLHAGVA